MGEEAGRIVVSGLTKRFGRVTAVDGLSFTVELLSPWTGGLVLAAWAVAFVAAGVMTTERTDIP